MAEETFPSSPAPDTPPRTTGGNFRWEPPTAEELQSLMPGYTIEKILGRGGMGAVYRGIQTNLDRPVAIKVLPPGVEKEDPTFAERFKSEAKLMAKLNHPAVVAVYDFGTTLGGQLYFAMEYVDGSDVSQMIAAQGRLPPDHALAITAHVCDALAAAHELGIVHRDIKPANVLINMKGQVKVADFGLAKVEEPGSHGLTKTGYAMGTPDFVAPEALTLGTAIDGRADLYAVGVMLYQMLTGQIPRGAWQPASVLVPGLDPRYDAIITKAMQYDRENRHSDAMELRRELDVIMTVPLMQHDAPASAAIPVAQMAQAPGQRSAAQRPMGKSANAPVRSVAGGSDPGPLDRATAEPKSKVPVFIGIAVALGIAVGASVMFGGGGAAGPPSAVVSSQTAPGGPSAPPSKPASVASATPKPPAAPTPSNPAKANEPPKAGFTNSLGMKFVPVPDTGILMCIHETRYQDYAAYAAQASGVNDAWKNQQKDGIPCGHEDNHPVCGVSWEDAVKFCEWLSKKEGKTYRLPTDEEWSSAVGLGRKEKRDKDTTPEMLSGKEATMFPWDSDHPPKTKDKAGNFADESWHEKFPTEPWIAKYSDGYPTTAPVMSFMPNKAGLYDLGGNVWEWMEDWWNEEQKEHVLRGGSWNHHSRSNLLSSHRNHQAPDSRGISHGFRVVLVPRSAPAPQATAAPVPAKVEPPKPAVAAGGAAGAPAAASGPAMTKGGNAPATTGAAPAAPSPAVAQAEPLPALPPELAALDAQFLELQKERVTAPFEADLAKLNAGYLGGIDREIANEKKAGRLDGVIALEAEKKLVQGMGGSAPQGPRGTAAEPRSESPTPCPIPAEDDEKTPASLKALRGIYRGEFAKLEAARAANLKALTDPLIVRLKQLVATLTKQDRIADAKKVREYREALEAGGSADTLVRNTTTGGTAVTTNEADRSVRTPLLAATKDKPFVNSLGMKFVPVPDTDILMCIHETRYKDYAAYDAEVRGVQESWKDQAVLGFLPAERPEDHPVTKVTWDSAKKFCEWLSSKDGVTVRLPTDREWSYAVGIGRDEDWKNGVTPEMRSAGLRDTFPWGTRWPPPRNSGNYADISHAKQFQTSKGTIAGYDDGYPTTAPVMSFKANKLGIHDLGGNLSEWCEDWRNEAQDARVTRGGSCKYSDGGIVRSAHREGRPPNTLYDFVGFRVVIDTRASAGKSGASAKPAVPTPATAPSRAPPKADFTNSLGMMFMPVKGTDVLFCIHETRRQDYAAYAKEVPGVNGLWKNQGRDGVPCGDKDDHPVVGVSWDHAAAFCAWLSQKEGKTYRLPTDREWSYAVGIGRDERWTKNTTPESLMKLAKEFPWDGDYPPETKDLAGNYADSAWHEKFPSQVWLEDYSDGYPTTAPVMSFKPNAFGLYDMGGNAREWVEDWWNEAQVDKVMRGAFFGHANQDQLLSSFRDHAPPARLDAHGGFRVVLEVK
ncbi:MAG: bifunctional serine/threonine-protein kinase/formylglycine-generating enzyme family protein [Prosthecobacter sp.]